MSRKKKYRNAPPIMERTPYMENAIFKYESDTFSASGSRITRTEARMVANRFVRNLVRNGHQTFDGVWIDLMLDGVRGSHE
jgi:hypothetical protein